MNLHSRWFLESRFSVWQIKLPNTVFLCEHQIHWGQINISLNHKTRRQEKMSNKCVQWCLEEIIIIMLIYIFTHSLWISIRVTKNMLFLKRKKKIYYKRCFKSKMLDSEIAQLSLTENLYLVLAQAILSQL